MEEGREGGREGRARILPIYVYEDKEKDGTVLQRRNTGTTNGEKKKKKKKKKTRHGQYKPQLPANNIRAFPSHA